MDSDIGAAPPALWSAVGADPLGLSRALAEAMAGGGAAMIWHTVKEVERTERYIAGLRVRVLVSLVTPNDQRDNLFAQRRYYTVMVAHPDNVSGKGCEQKYTELHGSGLTLRAALHSCVDSAEWWWRPRR